MRIAMIIFYLVLIIIGVSFAVLNANSVTVNLFFTTFDMSVSLLITVTLGLGVLIGSLLFSFKYWRLKMAYRRMNNRLKITEKEVKNLRSIPLQDEH